MTPCKPFLKAARKNGVKDRLLDQVDTQREAEIIMSEYDSIEDADLLAYLDGQLDPETTNLINGSPALQQKARQLASLESGLHQHLFRIDCPEGMELAEYATGRLQHAQQQRVVAHLASCPHCRAEMRSIQQLDRKSTRLNSSHVKISYAVFCLKKKKEQK